MIPTRLLRPASLTTGLLLAVGSATKGRWWDWGVASTSRLEQLERNILNRAIQSPYELTKVSGLGTVVVPCTDEVKRKNGSAENLVLIHGFGGGNAMWATNFDDLAKEYNVYAVEWIGVGRSDRPDFHHKNYDEADAFVVNAFEEWRKTMGLTRFHLCGHSMGAMLSSSYALKYPDYVSHLVLASPVGVGHPPSPIDPSKTKDIKMSRAWLLKFAAYCWEAGVTPMSLIRAAGPYGPQFVSNILHKRIEYMPKTSAIRDGSIDLDDLAEYIYHNWALKASGEKTMATHLAPMSHAIHAIRPLIDALLPDRVQMPMTFLYGGECDWMDYTQGEKIVNAFKAKEKKAELHLVPLSGHQLFIDNPKDFNRLIIESIEEAK